MALTYDLLTPRDLFEKLKREAAKLEEQADADNLFNFAVTAYHVVDWIKEGPAKTSTIIERDRKTLLNTLPIQICRDIANASKHFVIRNYTPTVDNIILVGSTYGTAVYGYSTYGGKQTYVVRVGSDSYDIRDLKEELLRLYETWGAMSRGNL